MMLSELVPEEKLPVDVEITGITDDSRCVRAGDLFCALSGESFDGRSFVVDAVNRGAVAVVSNLLLRILRCRLSRSKTCVQD